MAGPSSGRRWSRLPSPCARGGVVTVMTKAWRVGTSICDSVVRASNKTTATGNVGANAIDGWRSGMYCRRLGSA